MSPELNWNVEHDFINMENNYKKNIPHTDMLASV